MNTFFILSILLWGQVPFVISSQENTPACITQNNMQVEGNSMTPLIRDQETILFLENFYHCTGEKPKKGDLVSYKYGGNTNHLIKKVVATHDDIVRIENKKLVINKREVLNSAGKSYHFSQAELHLFQIYIPKGHLPKNSYFLLGDNIQSSLDSRKFGAISSEDITGKFKKR